MHLSLKESFKNVNSKSIPRVNVSSNLTEHADTIPAESSTEVAVAKNPSAYQGSSPLIQTELLDLSQLQQIVLDDIPESESLENKEKSTTYSEILEKFMKI